MKTNSSILTYELVEDYYFVWHIIVIWVKIPLHITDYYEPSNILSTFQKLTH